MLIGELATAADTTIRALRYYEQQGLLRPRRTPNGYRVYDETAITLLKNIKLLLTLGLTTNDIRALLACLVQDVAGASLCPASARVIADRLADVEEKITALDTVRENLIAALGKAGGAASFEAGLTSTSVTAGPIPPKPTEGEPPARPPRPRRNPGVS